jgi:putative ABC transport system permease protein
MDILSLAIKSLRNRRFSVGLTIASIALSVALLLGVERLRSQARTSFTNTISGTDLIVGARTSPVQLLLASVFGLSDATRNIGWESYEAIAGHPGVAWTIPISLGDTHGGFRVVGTTGAYFEHFRYGRRQALTMNDGAWFASADGAVVGADVAENRDYRVGNEIVVAHGAGDVSFVTHDAHPFRISGILARTGTPVDRAVFVSLSGIDAIHAGMEANGGDGLDPLAGPLGIDHRPAPGARGNGHPHAAGEDPHRHDHEPTAITAFFIGLKSRSAALAVQRTVNEYPGEALIAVMPAVALQQLWDITGVAEKALLAVSAFVVLVGLSGMLVSIMNGLNERRREMAVLRSVGARPVHVFSLIVGEAALVTIMGLGLGTALLFGLLAATQPVITTRLGIFIPVNGPAAAEWLLMGAVCLAGILVGLLPGYRIYRMSLADGMTVRM